MRNDKASRARRRQKALNSLSKASYIDSKAENCGRSQKEWEARRLVEVAVLQERLGLSSAAAVTDADNSQ